MKSMTKQQPQAIKRILLDLIKGSKSIFLVLILTLVQVVLSLYVPVAIGQFVDIVGQGGAIDWQALQKLLFILAITVFVNAGLQLILPRLIHRIVFNYCKKLRQGLMEKIHGLPMAIIDTYSPGQLVSRLIQDIDQLSDGLLLIFNQVISGLLTLVFAIITMGRINLLMMTLVIVLSPISLFVARFLAKNSFRFFKQQTELRSKHLNLVEDMMNQIKMVRLMNAQNRVQQQFVEINQTYLDKSKQAIFISSLTHPVTRFINALIYTLMILVGVWRIGQGAMSIGNLVTFLNFVNQYTKPFNDISSVLSEIQGASACANRIFDLLDKEELVDESRRKLVDPINGQFFFDKVDFSYVPNKPLIQNFNLEVASGQKIAIVGPTGAGKSTLINLLMRFYQVKAGQIFLDGQLIDDFSINDYRQQFGMVLQETWLKRASIHDNIAFAKSKASRKEVIKAAQAAHAHHFIEQLPQGYDTFLEDAGASLSVGQQQLLSIARLFIEVPTILILDEATSSIDTRTEMLIQNAFAKLMENRTTFIIAHRLSTIQNADLILVMDQGQIIEQGNHQELMKKEGFYYYLHTVNLSS